MKTLFILLLIIASSFICHVYADQGSDTWGPTTNNLQMSISLNCGEIKTNQPCILSIRYRNVSTYETFQIFEVNGTVYDPTYGFSVISPSGLDISPDMSKVRSGDSAELHRLDPGQTVTIKFNLSFYCKFKEVGIYKIVARKGWLWSREKHRHFAVISNPLKVTVTN